jgi:tetratricopeptide (TPR) repeat protein
MLQRARKGEEAIKEIKIAVQLDPGSAIIQTAAGTIHGYARLYGEAYAFLDKAIELERGFVPAHVSKSLIHQRRGDYHGAVETYKNVQIYGNLPGSDLVLDIMTAQESAAAGNRQKAFECLARILRHEIFKKDFAHFSPEIAQIYNLLGEREQTFVWLKKMQSSPNFSLESYNDPRFDNLRADSRFADLFAGSPRSV